MTAEIGELGVEQYLSLATSASNGENNGLLERAIGLHGSRERAIDTVRKFAELLEQFARRFGKDRLVCVYESPGRVNLMGMHTDHRGGMVNPVATWERVRAVCSRRDDDLIRALSLSVGEGEFRISDRLPEGMASFAQPSRAVHTLRASSAGVIRLPGACRGSQFAVTAGRASIIPVASSQEASDGTLSLSF